jgi:hypothetical protein
LMHTEFERYNSVTVADIQQQCNEIFKESNCNTLWYLAKN